MTARSIRVVINFALLVTASAALGQTIENVAAQNHGGKIIITYDLAGNAEDRYNISLFSSHDNYGTALKFVAGDVGKGITAGRSKRVEWDVVQELVTYKGDISFRIRGEVVPAPLSIKLPVENSTIRKGKTTQVAWSGGRKDQKIKLELIKDGSVVQSIQETPNSGSYTWAVPKDVEKGTYQLRLSGNGDVAESKIFTIKPKIPWLLIVAPVAAVAIVVAVLPGKDKPTNDDPDLPDAPKLDP